MTKRLVDRRGTDVRLARVLAQGGEGVIHEIEGRPGFVAKLYHQPPDRDKAAKLTALVEVRTERLMRLAAWPVEVLGERPGGPPLGIVLPHLQGYQDLHLLYGPKSRLATFPLAGWRFLIRAASNLARAFAVVHEHGHVVGDVNDKVALVSAEALVKLIDCDGFQIRYRSGVFTCDVGVLTHQPPELQGLKSFRGLKRGENHDAFGLAVLIFQLLFLARHPYSGSYGGKGDMPLERAIKEHRFVYGAGAGKRGMAPPPCSLDLAAVTPAVGELFERAFSSRAGQGGRPTARDWVRALDDLGAAVRRCHTNPCHAHLAGQACPFCALEHRAESALFNLPILSRTAGGRRGTVVINVPNLWKEIDAVEAPGLPAPLPAGFAEFHRRSAQALRRRRRSWSGAALAVALALALAPATGGLALGLAFLAPVLWKRGSLRSPERTLFGRCLTLQQRWSAESSTDAFRERAAELERARHELDQLAATHEKRMGELNVGRRQRQLETFLDRVRLADSSIPGLDPGARTVLESHGIETARDVRPESLRSVRGLSPALVQALLQWRAKQESRFAFDPDRGVDPVALAALEHEIQQRRADLVQMLADGPVGLRNCARQVTMRQGVLQKEIEALMQESTRVQAAA